MRDGERHRLAVPRHAITGTGVHTGQDAEKATWALGWFQLHFEMLVVVAETAAFNPRIKAAMESSGRIKRGEPGQRGRGKARELDPARSVRFARDEMLFAIVGGVSDAFPKVQAGLRNANGQVALAEVQHGFPEEPLMREPDAAVPIAGTAVVRSRLVNGRDADVHPQMLRGEEALHDALFLRGCADASGQRINAVQPHVEIDAAFIAQNTRRLAVVIVHHVAKIS